jgi:hypothetical protein
MQPLYDPKTYGNAQAFRPMFDPKSADVFSKPLQAFDDTYGELFRYELDTSQKAWMRTVADMQDLGARWIARRQEMMRDYAQWFDPGAQPAEFTNVWRRWANSCAQRLIDDVSDQMECAMRAATRLGEAMEQSTGASAKPTTPTPSRRVHARATVKTKRARKAANRTGSETTH